MKDFRVTITVKNNLLMSAIEEAGYDSAASFARAYAVGYERLNKYLNLKESPIGSDGDIKQSAELICDALGKNLHEIFPERFMEKCLARNSLTVMVDEDGLQGMLASNASPMRAIVHDEVNKALQDAIKTLKPFDAKCLILFHGLFGTPKHTLKDIGQIHNLSVESIRQKVLRAERMLTHPSRMLRPMFNH